MLISVTYIVLIIHLEQPLHAPKSDAKLYTLKSLQSTEIYINVEQAIFDERDDEFHVKVARNPEEVKALLTVGFQYVCKKDNLLFFRKRK